MISVDGRVIVVTGGGRNIGAAYAEGLASAGAAVVVADVLHEDAERTADAIASAGGRAVAVHLDVRDPASCEAMASSAIDEFGRIDVLVNNAARFGDMTRVPFEELDFAEWDDLFAVNVRGVMLATRACVPYMRSAGYGKVINIASTAALNGLPNGLHYAASKGAVLAMTRSMARELGPSNIRVLAVSPGAVMSDATLEHLAGDRSAVDGLVERQMIRRAVEPADIVPLIVFLASNSSDMIDGQNHVIDGGYTFI
jgi:NAD(P)-dependent dehydrogenase (short-subunit alcohol dehydrogenase family)